MKIKVIYILNASTVHGGANKAVLNLLDGLSGLIDPLVIISEPKGICSELELRKVPFKILKYYPFVYPPLNGIRDIILLFPRIIRNSFLNYRAVKLVTSEADIFMPHLIHTNVGTLNLGYSVSKKLKIPHIWHIREFQDLIDMYPFPSKRKFIKKLNSLNNFPIAITTSVFQHFGISEPGRIIYDGVLMQSKSQFIKTKKKYFLFAGRLEKNKGIAEVIDAFSEFNKSVKGYRLVIAGDTTDLHYKNSIYTQVNNKALTNYVDFLGMRDDIYNIMAEATALIVSSIYEGFGFVTVEAMFNGCLVIGNNTTGTKEIIETDQIGLLYSGQEELVSTMKKIVENGIESYFPLIIKAQEICKQKYSQEKSTKEIYSFYSEIIEKNSTNV